MQEFMKAATRLANAGAAYLEKLAGQESLPLNFMPGPVEFVPETEKKSRKPRTPKIGAMGDVSRAEVESAERAARAAGQEDPLMPGSVASTIAAAPAPAPAKEMTEQESSDEMQKVNAMYLKRFCQPSPVDGRPEGFTHLKALLSSKFKVARTTDLVHAQRVAYVTTVKAALAADVPVVA